MLVGMGLLVEIVSLDNLVELLNNILHVSYARVMGSCIC